MSNYYSNSDMILYEERMRMYQENHDTWAHMTDAALADYEQMVLKWQEAVASQETMYQREYAAWEESYAAWVEAANIDLEEPIAPENPVLLPKPQPHQPSPEPQPPVPPPIYISREVTEPEELDTEFGSALIMPGQIILTLNGISFSISPADLSRQYTEVVS
jgi:hypothetical protein